MAKLDAPLPPGFVEAIQQLLEERNRAGGAGHKRLYARDLHEEALRDLIRRADAGEAILFLATPSTKGRRSFWIDQDLKRGIDRLAAAHGVTRTSVFLTALHTYLGRQNLWADLP